MDASPAVSSAQAVRIRPPQWFARLSIVGGGACALLGVVAAVGGFQAGDGGSALVSLLGGLGLGALMVDVANRSATSDGDQLILRQWYRTVSLEREDILEFAAARASFVRWDIVAVPDEGTQTRLWVTRMLPAGRARRQRWLEELEAWRTLRPCMPSD